MALLAFEVQADWEEALRLREECDKLEKQLNKSKLGSAEFSRLSKDLFDTRQKMRDLVKDAATAGAEMENAFRVKDNQVLSNINKVTEALRKERAEIGRLGKAAEIEEKKLYDLQAANAERAVIDRQRGVLTAINNELGAHKGEEFRLTLDLNDLNVERMEAAKESELYKYIFESMSLGSEDASEAIKENLDGSFDELISGGNDVKSILQDIIETASGVSLGNFLTEGIQGTYQSLKGVYDKSIDIRAEMQDIESTMEVFLGSAEKSQQFVSELEDAAYFNMFEFSELVEGSKQMLAYEHSLDTIIPRLNQLSEVSTATHKPLLGLVDMYNRAKSIGTIDTRMQQSFASQGLVIKDVLKEMGETVSGTKISFEQFNRVLDYVTAEGGRFHGIMQSQLNNIEAERGALADNLHTMYNEIGQMIEGTEIKALKFQTKMVENWKSIATVLGYTAAAYGTYRAALLLLTATQTAMGRAGMAQRIAMISSALATDMDTKAKMVNAAASTAQEKAAMVMQMAKTNEAKASLIASVATDDDTRAEIVNSLAISDNAKNNIRNALAKGTNTAATISLSGAVKGLTATLKANAIAMVTNPYVLLAVAIAGVVAGVIHLATAESEEERAARSVHEAHERYVNSLKERRDEENRLLDIIADTTLTEWERYEAYKKMEEILPRLTKDYTMLQLAQMTPDKRAELMAQYQRKQAEEEDSMMKERIKRAQEYQKYVAGDGTLQTKEESNEYKELLKKTSRSKEENDRLRELANIGRERAKEMAAFFHEITGDEEVYSTRVYQSNLQNFVKDKQGFLDASEEERRNQEKMNMTYEERVSLLERQQQAAKEAKKEYDALLAVTNEQQRQNATTDDLIEMANQNEIDISEWLSLDEEQLRIKIIEALRKIDTKNGLPEIADGEGVNEGFFQTALDYANRLGGRLGSFLFGELANEEGDAALSAAKRKVEEKEAEAASTKAELDSLTSTRQIQKDAKSREIRLKALQRRFATGNVSVTDVEIEAAKIDGKLKDLLLTIRKQGGKLTEVQSNELTEYVNQDIQNAQNDYKNAFGNEAESAADRAYKLAQTKKDNLRKATRELIDAENESALAEIKAMSDRTEAVIRQRELDFKKEIEKIEQQKEDRLKAAEDAAKSEWMASSPDVRESQWESVKRSVLDRSESYKRLADAANMSYEAQMKSAMVRHDSLEGIAEKYDTQIIKNRKELESLESSRRLIEQQLREYDMRSESTGERLSGDEIVRMNKLTAIDSVRELSEDEFSELNKLENKYLNSPLSDSEVKRYNDLKEQYANLQGMITELSKKTVNELKKSFGTTSDQVDAILEEMRTKLSSIGNDDASRLNAILDANKKVIQTYESSTQGPTSVRIQNLNDAYRDAYQRIEDEITSYKAKANDERLSNEERANAQSLVLLAENAKHRMELQKTESVGRMNVEAITKSPQFFAAMQNPELLSNGTIQTLVEQLEQSRESLSEMDPKNLQTITSLIDKLMGVDVSRDPFRAMKTSASELAKAETELSQKTATLYEAQEKYNKAAQEAVMIDSLRRDLEAAEANGETEYANSIREKIVSLRQRQAEADTNLTNATNGYENAINRVISASARLDKANESSLGKIREMSSGFREIGSHFSEMGMAGEVFSKVTDTVSTILDAIMQVRELADEMDDTSRLSIETANSVKNENAANANLMSADKNADSALVGREASVTNQDAASVALEASRNNLEAARMQDSKKPDIGNEIPQTPEVNVETPDINVNVDSPEVKVESPDVNVEAPDVNVSSPDVNVDVDVPEVKEKIINDDTEIDTGVVEGMSEASSSMEVSASQNEASSAEMANAVTRFGASVDSMNTKNSTEIGNIGGGENAEKKQEGFSGMAKASAILQGIQMGMSVGSKVYDLISTLGMTGDARYERYARKLQEVNQLTSSVHRYHQAILLSRKAENEWFASSGLSSLQDMWKVGSQARDNYYAKLNEQQAAYRDKSRHDGDYLGNILAGSIAGAVTGAVTSGNLVGAVVGGVIGGVAGATTSYGQQMISNNSYQESLKRAEDNLRIETRAKHRSFIGIGGQNQKTEDLRSWVREKYHDELFDSEGFINKDLAEEVLSTYADKLQGETEATIKELMELKDQYDEYQENLEEYVSSLYSPLVDNMVDALWQWFDSGRDALYAFRESAADTFRGIMSDMMKTIILQKVVDGFQDKVKDLYDSFLNHDISEATLMRQVSGLTSDMMSRYESQMPVLQSMMTNMADTLKAMGIDLGQNQGGASGSRSVSAGVNQETMEEANGRMMSIQMALYGIWDEVSEINRRGVSDITLEPVAVEPVVSGNPNNMDYSMTGAESIVSVTQESMAMQMAMYSGSLTAIGGLAEQIAISYLELQGIHDDTTDISRVIRGINNRMNDWEQYITRL